MGSQRGNSPPGRAFPSNEGRLSLVRINSPSEWGNGRGQICGAIMGTDHPQPRSAPMARLPRLGVAGWPHLLTQQVHDGQLLARDDTDRQDLLDTLREAARQHGVAVHAYQLGASALVLLVTPERADSASLFMHPEFCRSAHETLGTVEVVVMEDGGRIVGVVVNRSTYKPPPFLRRSLRALRRRHTGAA